MRYILRQEFEAYDNDGYKNSESFGVRMSISADNISNKSIARLFRDICVLYGKSISQNLNGSGKHGDTCLWERPLNNNTLGNGGGLYDK